MWLAKHLLAIAEYAWSGRERLGLPRVKDDVIVLYATRRPDEVRDLAELLPPPMELTPDEIDGAPALMDSMTRDDLDSPQFLDTHTDARRRSSRRSARTGPCPRRPSPRRRAARCST